MILRRSSKCLNEETLVTSYLAAAASEAGLGIDCWSQVEKGEGKPKAATIEKIERLLEAHGIPISAAPHPPVRSS